MVHPTALVHPSVEIPSSSVVGPWCIVERGVEIAENVVLQSRVHVYSGVSIGSGTVVWDGAILGAPPQDLKYAGEETFLKIGKNCTLREYTTLNRGTIQGGALTEIKEGVLIMAYSHIGHDSLIEEGVVIANGCQLGGHVRIGKFATIGGVTAVQQKNQVGAYAFVGGTLKVIKDVPPASRAMGEPLKWASLNMHALRRFPEEFPEERLINLSRAYKRLYRSKEPFEKIVEELKTSGDPLFREFFDEHWSGTLIRP